MEIREINEEEYSRFISTYQFNSIYQTVEYASTMKKQGYNYLFFGAFENGTIVGASLLLIEKIKGYNYAYAPRGFLIDYTNKELLANFTREVKKFLSKKDVVAVKLAPIIVRNIIDSNKKVIGTNPQFDEIYKNLKNLGYYHFGFNSGFEAYKPRFEAMLDISKDYRLLFKNIKKEYKTKIRSAEKQGIKIFRANSNELNLLYEETKDKYPRDIEYFQDSYKYFNEHDKMDFYYAKLDTSHYLNLIQKKYREQEALCAEINHSVISNKNNSNKLLSRKIDADRELSTYRARLIMATDMLKEYPNGIVLASVLIAKNRGEIFLYMDGMNPKYRNFSAKHLILWKVIEKYSKLGYKRFNLGGMPDPRIDNPKLNGLVMFKNNFGCSTIEYLGDLELVVNNIKYSMYRQAKKGFK